VLPEGAGVTVVHLAAPGTNTELAQDHIRNLDEHLVLAGTGGLLTMLAVSGAGTLAGNAHHKTFEIIARAEARKISEVFQRQFDAGVLEARFPGRPRLASFELAANDEPDPTEVIDQVLKLSQAGLETDPAQITEKTGYRLVRGKPALPGENRVPIPPRPSDGATPGDP
jgi:hypothetical protein